jgi:intracellular multiplication protein IcmL
MKSGKNIGSGAVKKPAASAGKPVRDGDFPSKKVAEVLVDRPAKTPFVVSHHDAAVATRLVRSSEARERTSTLLRTCYVLSALLAISLIGNVSQGLREPQVRYLAHDPEGRIREIMMLERPLPSNAEVTAWAARVVAQAYTMSFGTFQQDLQSNRINFTSGGWRAFEKALTDSNFQTNVIQNFYVTHAVATAAPSIVAEGLEPNINRYAWRIQVPVVVTFASANSKTSQNVIIEVTIIRRPESENPAGLGIATFIVS